MFENQHLKACFDVHDTNTPMNLPGCDPNFNYASRLGSLAISRVPIDPWKGGTGEMPHPERERSPLCMPILCLMCDIRFDAARAVRLVRDCLARIHV